MQTADDERAWWDALEGDEVERNTAGWPPYDVDAAAALIFERLKVTDDERWCLLDLGCGVGRLTERLGAMLPPRAEVWGVDIAPRLIQRASTGAQQRNLRNIEYRVCDGRRLPPDVRHLDGGWAVTVFQHLPHDAVRSYLFQISAVLEVGGRFVATISHGIERAFLSHQAMPGDVTRWAGEAGLGVVDLTFDDVVEGWSWYTFEKGAA